MYANCVFLPSTTRQSTGTGFLIRWDEGDDTNNGDNDVKKTRSSVRIVTNAHVVRNASTVRARASFGPYVVSCETEWVSLPLDLALVKITGGDWEDFCRGWGFDADVSVDGLLRVGADGTNGEIGGVGTASNNKPTTTTQQLQCLNLSTTLPSLDENVTCCGFPMGGSQISVTRGVVSRIDVDSQHVLRIQIDAAINPGNSGGPVFDEHGDVVGVASAHLRAASNIGYIIPGKIVELFLNMCRDGLQGKIEDRYCGLGISVVVNGVGDDANASNGSGGRDGNVSGEAAQEPKHVPGIPTLAILGSQNLESKALRRTLGLEDLDGGVRVCGVRDEDGEEKKDEEVTNEEEKSTDDTSKGDKLKANDVLLAIDGIPIGYDGTIQLSATRPDERINFRSLVTCQRVGSKVLLDVLRDKQRKELEVVLDTCQFLVPQYDGFDACPLYTVCGGCVFCEYTMRLRFPPPFVSGASYYFLTLCQSISSTAPLTVPLISEKKSNKISSFSQYFRKQRTGNEQLLVLHKVLNDEVNVGYHGWRNMILKSVNGYTPKNIQELVDIIVRKVKGKTVEFHVQSMESEDADWIICMDTQEVLDAEQRILYRHMIASWTSTDAISRELRDAIEEGESSEAEKSVCYNTMCGMRKALGKKEKDEEK